MPVHKPLNCEEIEKYLEEDRAKYIWNDGEYSAEITKTQETTSKSSGAPMWVIESTLKDEDKTTKITSYYVFKDQPVLDDYKSQDGKIIDEDKKRYDKDLKSYMFCVQKVRELFQAVDKIEYYETNKVDGESVIEDRELLGCKYKARTKKVTDDRGDKMTIIKCLKDESFVDDDLPF